MNGGGCSAVATPLPHTRSACPPALCQAVAGTTKVTYQGEALDFSAPFAVKTVQELLAVAGLDLAEAGEGVEAARKAALQAVRDAEGGDAAATLIEGAQSGARAGGVHTAGVRRQRCSQRGWCAEHAGAALARASHPDCPPLPLLAPPPPQSARL